MIKSYFKGISNVLLNELDNATVKIVVAVYWFTNHTLFQKLIEKLESGLRVELIIHNDYINNRVTGLNFQEFIKKGGEFYFSDMFNPMHNKFCVIDNEVLINGSYNWTYYAENRNSENILLIKEERDVINSFVEEFEKLKRKMEKVDKITPLTRFEVDEYNLLNTRDYLANDIVFQSVSIGDKNMIEDAFLIAPENIEVQKTAFDLNLTNKYILKHTIGSSLLYDRYLIFVTKGSFIPFNSSEYVQTTYNNQISIKCKFYNGEDVTKASNNNLMAAMLFTGLPPKPVGEAKMRYDFTIDINGNLRIEMYSLDNGIKKVYTRNIRDLLIPYSFSEILISTIDDIKVNFTKYIKMSPIYNKEKSEELKGMIIKQINLVANLCTSLEQANILLSHQERDIEYSLWGIKRQYKYTSIQNILDIDNALSELCNYLTKQFPEDHKN